MRVPAPVSLESPARTVRAACAAAAVWTVGLIWATVAPPLRAELVINEIMYNSPGSPDVEYVELYNTRGDAIDLTGLYLLDDDDLHDRCMLTGTLSPGQYLVVAGSLALFQEAYPGVTNVNVNPCGSDTQGSGFGLGNGSDSVRLFDSTDTLIDFVSYKDAAPWPVEADGDGSSLELRNPVSDNEVAENWAASTGGPPYGSPGARNTVFVDDLPPTVDDVERSVALPGPADSVVVSAVVADDRSGVTAELFFSLGGGEYTAVAMLDDGLGGDDQAGDGIFSVTLAAQPAGTLLRYYVAAVDSSSQVATGPDLAPDVYLAYTVGHVPPLLLINEILASNAAGRLDEAGDADDWLEVRNPGPDPVALGGMFLSNDTGDTKKWPLPFITLQPGGHLLVWCDDEAIEGPLHANFRLSRDGGEVALYDTVDTGNARIHGFTFGPQGTDVSFGYFPDGADAPEFLAAPTPGIPNGSSALYSAVCINEFLASSQLGVDDWIEFHNRGAVTVDVSGWFVSDDAGAPFKYVFPPGTLLAPGDFVALDETVLGFGLGAAGNEVITLTHADGVTGQDYFDFGPQLSDISQGRYVDGAAHWHSFSAWTRGTSNDCSVGGTPPGLVPVLRMASADTLTWNAADGAQAYDVVLGDLLALRAAGGDFTAAISGCLDNNSSDLLAWDPGGQTDPVFYLVRAVDRSCGFGSYDTGSFSQTGSRDAGIQNAIATCP